MMLGLAHLDLGERDEARPLLEQAVALARIGQHPGQLNDALFNLAYLEDLDNNSERAVELLEEAREEAEERTSPYEVAFIDVFVAGLLWRQEGTEAARHRVLALTESVLQIRDPQLTRLHAGNCAVVLAGSHQPQAAALLGAADEEGDRVGLARSGAEQDRLNADLEMAGASIASEEWSHHYLLGRTSTLEEALTDVARLPDATAAG